MVLQKLVFSLLKYYYCIKFTALLFIGFLIKGRGLFEKKHREKPSVLEGWDSRYIKLKKVRLHYVQTGSDDKPLMLFIHGYPEFWYSWRFQLKEFANRYRCVAIDQRGYNLSDKPKPVESYAADELVGDVRDVIEGLGYKKAVVVAHDWGGLVAWKFAEAYPEMVDKLICCNIPRPGAFRRRLQSSWSQFRKSWYMFFFQNKRIPELLSTADDMKMLEGAFRGEMGIRNKKNFTDDDLEAWKYSFSMNGASFKYPINYYRNIFNNSSGSSKDIVLEMPTLIIWGTADGALDIEAAEDSLKTLRNGTMKKVLGASHWVQQDEPEQVNQHISEFLSKN
ncbi:hypothetical protein GCK72_011930 [Caenorhabditis remanei]|uniref:AB hydrolase-1 domain-containing protein n=1 Tax=Caenorhabditis remanei TaxID=31234 RepID=A0A6A5HB49_CAERE|nr:hypothetical protein GCK72_011930 [Caenorhabditis remanei]KAF1763663.1 hypothetical protein GCK72_011930 [Caenorhabditis remanei]